MVFRLRQVGWVVPTMMGFAAVASVFAVTAGRSFADEGRNSGRQARCVSTPFETTEVLDRNKLYVEDRSGNAAIITMSNNCMWKGSPVGFELYGGGQICKPIDVNVTGELDTSVPIRCMAESVQLLSRDEAKAYRERGR